MIYSVTGKSHTVLAAAWRDIDNVEQVRERVQACRQVISYMILIGM